MPRPKSDWIKCNFYLPPQTVRAIKGLAQFRGATTSELVRRALQKYAIEELTKERNVPTLDSLTIAFSADLVPSPTELADDEYVNPTPRTPPAFRR